MTSLYRIFVVLLIQGYVASSSKCGRCKFFTNLHDGHREAACTDVDKYTLCRNGELTETEVICGERKVCNHKNYESPCQDAGSVEPDCPAKHNPDKTLQSCHLNSICKRPGKIPDLYDATCRRYLTCKMGSHGSLEGQIEQCPLGQQFDIRSENCVQEIQAGCPCTSKHCTCEGIMADPTSKFSFLTCVQIGRSPDFQVTKTVCPSGMYFDNAGKTCLPLDECVIGCPVTSKNCIKDGVFPHPKDRNAFITCKLVEGTSYFEETTTYCGKDEYFDGISLSCVNLNQCKTARKDQCPLLLDACVTPGVKVADPTNWKHYISCNYIGIGSWIEGIRLSCKDDEFFSNLLQKCESLVYCLRNRIVGCPHISSVCDKAGRKESSKKWNLYIECISIDKSIYFEEKEYSCGPDKFFDKKSESCLDLVECTDPNQNCPKVSKICTSEGNIPYPGDKYRYIVCSKIEGTDLLEEKIVSCGVKKSFDIRRKICRDSATATIFIEKDKK